MNLSVVPLHQHPEHLQETCRLLNEEWKRSETARLHSLTTSCDTLPTCLIMLQDKTVIGHAKLSKIPNMGTACFIESVVISRHLRRKGFGTILMEKAEHFCRDCLHLDVVFLSTHDQEKFYNKLGYNKCAPVSIYGNCKPICVNNSRKPSDKQPASSIESLSGSTKLNEQNSIKTLSTVISTVTSEVALPPPPPLPLGNSVLTKSKVFMMKAL